LTPQLKHGSSFYYYIYAQSCRIFLLYW